MKIIQGIKNILSRLYGSLKRFPATVLLSASVCTVLIAISEINPKEYTLRKIAMVLAIGIPLSLCIKLFFEKKEKVNKLKVMASYALGALLLVLYYFFLLKDFKMVAITRYIGVTIALYLGFIYIPYFSRREKFERYVITLFTSFFITVLYSMVLYLGLSAILFATDKLLGIVIKEKVYYYTWLIVVFIFAVSYFLSQIPLKEEEQHSKPYPKLLKILILYIVMPLLSAYTTILYIYFCKIILTSKWPINIVTNLVLWYSIITAIVLFFITPIKEENKWGNSFLRFFPKIILPILIMMFISIGIRINAYGITEKRYYVVILAIWVFTIMLYYSFAKKIRNIILPFSLSIIAILSVFGPLSSFTISKFSQNNRLEKILIKNNMMKDNKIQPSTNISTEDKIEVSSILNYFDNTHSLKEVKNLPENFKIDNMNNVFGFPSESGNNNFSNEYFYFRRENGDVIDVKGYDYLIDNNSIMQGTKTKDDKLDLYYDYNSNTFKLKISGKEAYSKNLNAFIKNVSNKYKSQFGKDTIPSKEMTLVDENEEVKIKFIFISISGQNNQSLQNMNAKELEFYVLIKIK